MHIYIYYIYMYVCMYVCICMYIYIYQYITYLPPVIIHLLLFINHLKISLKGLLKQTSNHFTVQSLS